MTTNETDLPPRLVEDIDPRLLNFLKTQVNSFVKWDLLRFFHENPNAADIADNVARYVGRSPVFIEKQLIELAETGILHRERLREMVVYSLTADREMRDLIEQFMLACDDRQFRVKVVYHIVRNMSGKPDRLMATLAD